MVFTVAAQNSPQNPLPIMPLPAHAERGSGAFVIDESFAVSIQGHKEPRLDRAQQRFVNVLSRETGIPLFHTSPMHANAPKLFLNAKSASKDEQELGEDESYRLQVTATEVHLDAPNPLGILRGLQTFLQLVHPGPSGFEVPAVVIEDKPRFAWRGLMIDSSRHFMPIEVIKRNLDGMEALKLNVFHWHLSDNQGFRVESKEQPLLHEKGSDGLFYTQAEVKDVIQYARDRGIRVVPEFDMPGHTTAWFVGYPDLASGPGPYEIERKWGIFDPAMDPTRDSTYKFLDGFVEEMAHLFPDKYFHIGGDEVNGKEWDANPKVQEFKRAHNLANNEALQAYFTAKVQKIVAKHGKIMEGWDEVLQPETPKDVVIQSWRGQDSLAQAAKQGNRGLLSFGYYLDLMQPAAEHYGVDPMAKAAVNLSPAEKERILGGEACMWSEYASPENMDQRIWSRMPAIAERLWSAQDVTDVNSMYERIALVSAKLEHYGLQHLTSYPMMLERMSGEPDTEPLRVLGNVVEPPKGYNRGRLGKFDQLTPLNHLVDAVPPESLTAREFGLLVDRIATKQATPKQWAQARQWLTLWRDNDARLAPMLSKSNIVAEVAPQSKNLAQIASIGLQALDALHSESPAQPGWKDQQLAILKAGEQPQAVLLNMIAPQVEKLVNAVQ
jgi:hexosaminidase